MDANEVFFHAVRQNLAPLKQRYGFVEDHSEHEGIRGQAGILVMRSSELRVRVVMDKGPQLWLDVAPPTGDWFDVALLAEWLGDKAKAEAAAEAMPPVDTPLPWAPLELRVETLSQVVLELMPELLRLLGDPMWVENAKEVAALRDTKLKEWTAAYRVSPAPARSGISWLGLLFVLLIFIAYVVNRCAR